MGNLPSPAYQMRRNDYACINGMREISLPVDYKEARSIPKTIDEVEVGDLKKDYDLKSFYGPEIRISSVYDHRSQAYTYSNARTCIFMNRPIRLGYLKTMGNFP